jgi:membrane protein DedA with SNARE-associated domain
MPYLWTVILMAAESTMIPIPSEAVMTPAGALAALGKANAVLLVIAGMVGSVIGSIVSYYIGKK